jgi:hypothetical protein
VKVRIPYDTNDRKDPAVLTRSEQFQVVGSGGGR